MAQRELIDAVWDDTARVLAERGRRLAPVALLAFALPAVVQAAARLFPVFGPARGAVIALLVSVAGLLLSLWGGLAVIGLATGPGGQLAAARRLAGRRLPASLGVAAVLALGALLLTIPVGVAAALAGADVAAMSRGAVASVGGRPAGVMLVGTLLLLAVLAWLGARLLPTQAVVLHERRGLRAIPAAFRLTRGVALRLVAAELLFALVVLAATLAAQGAVGTVLLLLLGSERAGLALFLTAIVSALVSAALVTLAYVFVARLYERLSPAADRIAPDAAEPAGRPGGPWTRAGAAPAA